MKKTYALLIIATMVATACGSRPEPTATQQPAATQTPNPTETLAPTVQPTPIGGAGNLLIAVFEGNDLVFVSLDLALNTQREVARFNRSDIFPYETDSIYQAPTIMSASPDGQWVAIQSSIYIRDPREFQGTQLHLLNLENQAVIQVYDTDYVNRVDEADAAWSPNGRGLAFRGNSDVVVWNDISSTQETIQLIDDARHGDVLSSASGLAWSPNGQYLVFWKNDKLWLADVFLGNTSSLATVSSVDGLQWSADTRFLFFTGDLETKVSDCGISPMCNYGIYKLSVPDGTISLLADDHIAIWVDQSFIVSPSGDWIVFTSNANSPDPATCGYEDCIIDVFLVSSDGTDRRSLSNFVESFGYFGGLIWSPDQEAIAFLTYKTEEELATLHVLSLDGKKLFETTFYSLPSFISWK